MNRIYFIGLLLFGFIFSECADMNKLDCMLSVDCDWDENMVTGNCANFSSSSTCSNIDQCSWVSTQQACPNITAYSDCVAIPGCSYSWLTYTCGGTTTITYCSGGSYEFDNGTHIPSWHIDGAQFSEDLHQESLLSSKSLYEEPTKSLY